MGNLSLVDNVTGFEGLAVTDASGNSFVLNTDTNELQDTSGTKIFDVSSDMNTLDANALTASVTLKAVGNVGVNLIGSAENDSLTGAGGDDVIFGGLGVDTLDGGADIAEVHVFTINSSEIGDTVTIDGVTITVDGDTVADKASAIAGALIGEKDNFDNAAKIADITYDDATSKLSFHFNKSDKDSVNTIIRDAETTGTLQVNLDTEATTAYAGNGNDTFVVVGKVNADTYIIDDLTDTKAGTLGLSVQDILTNEKLVSDVTTDTFDGGAGDDTLELWGDIDLTNATLTSIEHLDIHSDVTISAAQLAGIMSVTMTTVGSKLTIGDVSYKVNDEGVVARLDTNGDEVVETDEVTGDEVAATLANTETTLSVNGVPAMDQGTIDPTYTLAADATAADEGTTATFTLTTTDVAKGTEVAYALSGVKAADVEGGLLDGTATVDANGSATISIALTADDLTEGSEILTVTAEGVSASTTINDTSLDIVTGNVIDLSGNVTGVDGVVEVFSFAADTTGDTLLTGFTVGEDSLSLDLDPSSAVTTLDQLNGFVLTSGDTASVQANQITGSTFVNLGLDAAGNAITLELSGVADATLVDIVII